MKTLMMRSTLAVMMALHLACDDDGSDDASDTEASPDSQDDDDGRDDDDGEPSCEMDSPQGDACGSAEVCSVACLCEMGVVNSGRCTNGACADPVEACESACEDFDEGEFSGAYCALENPEPDDDDDDDDETGAGEETGSDGPACVPTGDVCQLNGDCCGFDSGSSLCTSFDGQFVACADVCIFDSDCASDCCVPLDGGGRVCGPSNLCS